MVRTMINEYRLPQYLWAKAVNTLCYISNRIYFCKNTSKTPFEIYFLRKLNVSYFRVFCCSFVLNTKDNVDKFDAKSYETIFFGYLNSSKAYRVFNMSILTIEEPIHVKFEESNAFVKNVIKIDFLDEDIEKISLKDSPMQEDKQKADEHGEVQDIEVEPTQPLSKGLEICYKSSQRPHHR